MKRTFSKKSMSMHKENVLKQELTNIQNAHVISENILEKLLRPSNAEKTKTLELKKYNPKFQKKDYETLSQENYELKKSIKNEKQMVTNLKFQIIECERKLKFLQNIQQKWQESLKNQEETKKQPVYTQILKKKIQELSQLYLNAEEKIKELKRLPHVSVFQESDIEKQYLLRETGRLKAIITSLTSSHSMEGNLENQFLKLMKEENQKLKSTVRLLQNDKNLLKSRQILQKRQINDYKRQVQKLEQVIKLKEAQHQTTKNQYKNMIFKKAQQLIKEQQKKQNEQLNTLQRELQQKKNELRLMRNEKDTILESIEKYKNNERLFETHKEEFMRQKNKLIDDLNKVKKMNQELRNELEIQKENLKFMQSSNKKKKKEKIKPITKKIEEYPPVKFEDLELSLIVLIHQLDNRIISNISELFTEEEIKCSKLIQIFCEQPIGLEKSEAMKLARYILEDNTNKKVKYDQNTMISTTLCVTILKASINRVQECRNTANEDIWRCILAKNKKLIHQIQKISTKTISKQSFLQLLSKNIRQNFNDYITLVIIQSFDVQNSETQIFLNTQKLNQVFRKISTNKRLR